jgi:hypothetical protein
VSRPAAEKVLSGFSARFCQRNQIAELEEAIARTRRRLDELHRRYLEIIQGVLAEHAGPRVG